MATFKSILSTIFSDVKKVVAWVGSSKVVTVIEDAAEAVDPGLAGIFNLANTYITEAVKTEALFTAAGQQSGTGVQKLAAVTSAVTPAVLQYAQQAGLPVPTADKIQAAANGVVAFLNALEGK